MAYAPQLARLMAIWREQPRSTAFAPLADALRKAGEAADALDMARNGVAARPDYLPGHLVLARLQLDAGDTLAAVQSLRAAAGIDPAHPMVVAELQRLAGPLPSDLTPGSVPLAEPEADMPPSPEDDVDSAAVAESEPVTFPTEAELDRLAVEDGLLADDETFDFPDSDEDSISATPPVMTESLAMLYREQGHLDRAAEVFDALVERHPDNDNLVARRDGVRAEMRARQPRPYSAAESGGTSVREWLATIATASAPATPLASGFDAFYEAPDTGTAEHGDMAAFQAWLKELDR